MLELTLMFVSQIGLAALLVASHCLGGKRR